MIDLHIQAAALLAACVCTALLSFAATVAFFEVLYPLR